jgi:hypothetical protein
MAILDGDIKLLKSAVLDDVPEGGGMATGRRGRRRRRTTCSRTFPSWTAPTAASRCARCFRRCSPIPSTRYYGAHVIVAQAPADPRVSAALFTTRSWSDERTSAQNKLESYSRSAPRRATRSTAITWSASAACRCTAPARSPLPASATCSAWCSATRRQLPVRARDPDHLARQSIGVHRQHGDYLRDVMVLEISDPLRLAFTGANATRYTATTTTTRQPGCTPPSPPTRRAITAWRRWPRRRTWAI